MTVSQFILELENHNAEVLRCLNSGEDYSELLKQFRDSDVLEREELKKAFDVFNLTQPEFYIGTENYTSEIQQLLNDNYWGTTDIGYQINYQIEKPKHDTYACYLENYDMEYDYFEGVVKRSKTPLKTQREHLKELQEYRTLCQSWKIELAQKDFRFKSLSDIHAAANKNIIELIGRRGTFAPRYIMDLDNNGIEKGEIYDLVMKLEELDTFPERVAFLKSKLKGTTNKNDKGHLFMIKKGKYGEMSPFLKETIKTGDSCKKQYYNSKLPFSYSSRNFIIMVFFYLSLPFEDKNFEDFLAYHGYGIAPNLPLIANRNSAKNKNYTEDSNIYYDDIKDLYESGLSYNTLLTVLFGHTTYRDNE